jgi:hypothetical protein
MHGERWPVLLALLFAALALVQTLRLAWLRGAPARRLALARRAGREGERAARALVERAGYCIEAHQPELEWTIVCDGAPFPVALRADLIVSRAGRRFVAEIKNGASAGRLDLPATRRQLLEYAVAYAVDGALLVDIAAQRVHEVEFGLPAARSSGSALLVSALVLSIAGACAWLYFTA